MELKTSGAASGNTDRDAEGLASADGSWPIGISEANGKTAVTPLNTGAGGGATALKEKGPA